MCGASSQQTQIEAAQAKFYDVLTSQYQTIFGESQGILKTLTASFEPILAAGINQQGFSPAELQNLQSMATTGTGQTYAKAEENLANIQAAEGGGNAYVPSGAKSQERLQLASSAAESEAGIQSNITASNYATGRANYLQAAGLLGGVASQYNPAAFAGAATGAGSAAAQTANEITQANNSWMSMVSGGLGAAATAYAGR